MKEQGYLKIQWIPTSENNADLFTKNLARPIFEEHVKTYCGEDEYMARDSQGEGVTGREVKTGVESPDPKVEKTTYTIDDKNTSTTYYENNWKN